MPLSFCNLFKLEEMTVAMHCHLKAARRLAGRSGLMFILMAYVMAVF